MDKQLLYDQIHATLAGEFKTTSSIIAFIRGVAMSNSFRKDDLLNFLIERLKIPKLGEKRMTKYRERLDFIGKLTDEQFEYIVTYQP